MRYWASTVFGWKYWAAFFLICCLIGGLTVWCFIRLLRG